MKLGLTKYTTKPVAIPENLLPVESKFIQRALSVKVKDVKPLQVVNDLTATFTTAYTIAGQQAEPVALALYVDEFYKKLMETYPCVTIEEVKAAIRAGVYGEYGDYYGLNPKTFIGFVRSYLFSQERREAKRKFEIPVLQESKPTIEELEKSNQEFAEILYQDYLKEKLQIEFIPSFIYDFLTYKNCFELCGKTKKELHRQAGYYLQEENKSFNMAVLMGKVSKLSQSETGTRESRQTTIAKQFAVQMYFELCKLFKSETIF